MAHDLSLEHLTVAAVGPLDLIEIAHDCGCRAVNLRMEPAPYLPVPFYEVVCDSRMQAAIRAKAQDCGIVIHTVDPFVLREDVPRDRLLALLDAAAVIGAQAINTVCYESNRNRLADSLAILAQDAADRGLVTRVELFALSAINSLEKALGLARVVGRADVTLNADILHLTRTGGSMTDLAAVPASLIGYAQICDGLQVMPVEDQMAEATLNWLLPGEGEFDLVGFIRALPGTIKIGIEVPSNALTEQGLGPREKAKRIVEATRRVQQAAAEPA